MSLDVERLFELWPMVFGYVRRRLDGVDYTIVEDICGDTFLLAIRHADRYEERGDGPRNWLLTIASRQVVDWLRSESLRGLGRTTTLDVVDDVRACQDAGTNQHDALLDLRAALAALPPGKRQLLSACWLEDVPVSRRAAALGISRIATTHRVRRAGQALRAVLEAAS